MSLLPDLEGLAMFAGHPCPGYACRIRSDVWRFTNAAGEDIASKPEGPLRVTNADTLLPTVLAGLAIAEFPEFIAADHVRAGQLVRILEDWQLARGGLYFVTPSARTRPARGGSVVGFLHEASEFAGLASGSLTKNIVPRQFLKRISEKMIVGGLAKRGGRV
jgi:DNA-binding transcriptional LysR family regulator